MYGLYLSSLEKNPMTTFRVSNRRPSGLQAVTLAHTPQLTTKQVGR